MNGQGARNKKPESDPGKNSIAVLFCAEPLVRAFPGFLKDFLDQIPVGFGASQHGEAVGAGITYLHDGVWKLAIDPLAQFAGQRLNGTRRQRPGFIYSDFNA